MAFSDTRYPGVGQPEVLRGVNLRIPVAKVTAIVGASGSGKTTLLKLLLALYRPTGDEITLGEVPVSALDPQPEATVYRGLREFARGRTVVVIAHRLSTVRDADQIVVLDRGRIVEIGTHSELVSQNGAYFRLVRDQLELEAGSS